jgi:hypothetical protein
VECYGYFPCPSLFFVAEFGNSECGQAVLVFFGFFAKSTHMSQWDKAVSFGKLDNKVALVIAVNNHK